jgi:hypothetical protein
VLLKPISADLQGKKKVSFVSDSSFDHESMAQSQKFGVKQTGAYKGKATIPLDFDR